MVSRPIAELQVLVVALQAVVLQLHLGVGQLDALVLEGQLQGLFG